MEPEIGQRAATARVFAAGPAQGRVKVIGAVHEDGADLHGVCAEHQRRSDAFAIRDAACSDERQIDGGAKGISTQDLLESITQEFREHEDLPNTTNPDDWAKISGKKGERIVFIRTLVKGREQTDREGGRAIERVATGQYL